MAEQQPEDYSKLPLGEKLGHKVWRARLLGYEEATKLFRRIDDEASPEYSKFTGLIKKFVVDSNQMAQEKGVEAALAFVECASAATKICADVIPGVVTKCLNARPKTKEGGILLCLMFVEIEQHAVVQEEIMKGFSNKQPKIVAGSIQVLSRMVQEFGAKVINLKVLMKAIPALFGHSDKNVRAEAKTLVIELYKWFSAAIKPTLEKNLKPVQMKELEEEWSKLPPSPPAPTRLLRSDQQAAASAVPDVSSGGGGGGGVDESEEGGAVGGAVVMETIDPYDLADPVDLLGKMAKDFYDKVADPKWKERKEALENLLPLAQSMKLEPGDYGELMKALKKVITKDSNVLVVALAGNIVTGLAKGLRKGFQSYASFALAAIFEKFKEKKLNVVNSLRDAADAVYLTTTLGGFQDEATEALNSKNPSVKSETLLFLCRCFQQCTPAMVPKPLLKAICPLIVQKLDDTNPQVREAAQEALGTLLRVVGDRPLNPYIEGIDKTKMAKIQEHREAVELKIQTGVIHSPMKGQAATTTPAAEKSTKPPPKQTPAAPTPAIETTGDDGDVVKEKPKKKKPVLSSQKNPPKRRIADKGSQEESTPAAEKKSEPPPSSKPAPSSAPPSKKKAAGGKGKAKGKGKGGAAPVKMAPDEKTEPAIAAEEVEDKATAVLPSGLMDRMADPKWKERLEACEKFKEFVEGLPADEIQSLLFCKVLARKPGWKDSNFQVMKAKFDVVTVLVQKASLFGKKSTACVIPPLVEKFADIKVKATSAETLSVLAERMTLNYVSMQVMKHSFEQKSPKVHSESLDWLGNAIKEFGFIIEIKPQIDFIKKAFAATNPTVRSAAINLLGVIYMYLGAQLRMFFEGEKPALLQQIDAAFEKVSGESPPAPTRGPNAKTGDESEDDDNEEAGEGEVGGTSQAPVSLADLMPKVDISGQIKSDLIKELGDKNWKIRGEGLQKVQDIIKTAKFIQPSLGELPGALKGRLADSNKNLVISTLNIVGSLATSMGSGCSKYAKAFIPGTLSALADSKPQVRVAATASLNAWFDELTLVPLVEQEFLSTALATESPNLRVELLGWIEEKLPGAGKLPSELNAIVPPLLSCLEDRSGEVRKKAQVVVPLVMAKVGYDIMAKQAGKLKPASKQAVVAILEKHKSSAPSSKSSTTTKTKQTPAAAVETPRESATPSGGTAEKKTKKSTKAGDKAKETPGADGGGKKGTGKATSTRKGKGGQQAASESSGAALVFVPNGKESRTRDEEKMKTLKWNFPQPRSEHINQLKEQIQPCVSSALFTQLFHDDFKQHIAALATLTKGVSGDAPLKDAAIGCTDLLLRWVTLRFFDTNTTVNLKCLEFLNTLFKMLINDGDYRMSDYEANAFLPYLVNKVGDPKEPVRKGVRSLFRALCSFYPPSKLFGFVIEGLKSKNARQRMECLEELGVLIQNNGMIVCGTQPQKTMPLIASQISDRDNAVRSAALNAMVVVYGNVGDGVYKFTSQLSEKDVSLLEERIRRSGSKPPSTVTSEPPTAAKEETKAESVKKGTKQAAGTKSQASTSQDKSTPDPSTTAESPQPEGTTENEPSTEPPPPPKPLHVPGPFKIDFDRYKVAPLKKPSMTGLTLTPNEMSLIFGPNPEVPKFDFKSMKPPSSLSPSRMASTSAAVNFIISQVTSGDRATSCKALRQLESVMTSPSQRVTVRPHVDQLIRSTLMQMKMNFSTPLTDASDPQAQQEVMEMGKALISCLLALFTEPTLAVLVSQETLAEVERDVMTYLIDARLLKLEDAAQLIRSMNYFMSRVCENSDKTALYGSLFQVLLQSLNSDGSTTKITDLTLKCLWKTTRQLSQLVSSIKVDHLLKSLSLFMKAYHTMVPTPAADDIIHRTVRTVTFFLTDLMGEKILDHFTLIKDHKHTILYKSIQRILAKRRLSLEKETRSSTSKISSTVDKGQTAEKKGLMQASLKAVACLPPGASSELSEILKRIPQRSTGKEGLRELYHFQQHYPDFDLNEFMKDNSKIYQSYIQRGLKSVEAEIKGQGGSSFDPTQFTTEEYQKHHHELEELKLREGKSSSGKRLLGSLNKKENKPSDGNTSQVSQTSSVSTSTTKSGLDLKDLRRRLDMLKGTSH